MIFGGGSEKRKRIIEEAKDIVSEQRRVLDQIKKLYANDKAERRREISERIAYFSDRFKQLNERLGSRLRDLKLPKNIFKSFFGLRKVFVSLMKTKGLQTDSLEKKTLKRLKEDTKGPSNKGDEKIVYEDFYAKISNKIFSKSSKNLSNKGYFKSLSQDLMKANLKYTLPGYISIIMFTTLLSFFLGSFVYLFFIFLKIQATVPILQTVQDSASRALSFLWIPFGFPLAGFLISYYYPSLEKSSMEAQIDYELPFAVVNMAAIAGSMVNPTKIFRIIINSGEFPYVRKELIKLMNQVNIYGSDLVGALRITARHTPSQKMKELLNGLATTISSGGDLEKFFNKRSDTLLFEHRVRREKETKTAETFMDLYISIVIAAPMIFMLLLMMMRISGLGLALPTSTITLVIVGSVVLINIFFILYLHIKSRS